MPQRPIRSNSTVGGNGFFNSSISIAQTISANSFGDFSTALQSCFFKSITSNFPCRIRVYNSAIARDADFARNSYTTPKTLGYNNHGCIFDVILGVNSEALTLNFAPIPFHFGDNLYFKIENLDIVSRNFSILINIFEA